MWPTASWGGAVRSGVVGFLCIALIQPPVAAVQTSAPIQADIGSEEQRFRQQGKPEQPRLVTPPEIEDRTVPPPEEPSAASTRTVSVKTIQVEGTALVPRDRLRRLIAPYEGRDVSLADLGRLTTELTQWLRSHGYVTSRAYLPPQEVTQGVVTIQVLEGRVGTIQVEGARYSRPQALTARMKTRPGEPLEYRTLQQDLTRLNASPDRRVAAVLFPGTATGATDVTLRVEDELPFHVSYLMHNGGTKFTGRFRQGIQIAHGNVTGRDDQFVTRAEFSERSDFVGVSSSYLLPLGPSGRTLGWEISHARVVLGRQFRQNDITGNATVLGFTWTEPVWQAERWNAEWATGYDWVRVRSRELGSDRGKDDLRVLRIGPTLSEHDATGRSVLSTEVGIGFSGLLGASHKVDPAASRSGTGGQFARLAMAGGRLQRLPAGTRLLLRGSWQATNDRLPPTEGVRLGGEDTVRGYPEGEILGDHGYSGTAELQYPIPVTLPFSDRPTRSTLTLVGFVDGGAAFSRKPLVGEESKKRLIGLGLGCRWTLSRSANVLVDVGWPVGDDSSEGSSPQVYYRAVIGF